jgi:hypothetical protein
MVEWNFKYQKKENKTSVRRKAWQEDFPQG